MKRKKIDELTVQGTVSVQSERMTDSKKLKFWLVITNAYSRPLVQTSLDEAKRYASEHGARYIYEYIITANGLPQASATYKREWNGYGFTDEWVEYGSLVLNWF